MNKNKIEESNNRNKASNKNRLKKYFFTGFFSILPIILTFKIFQFMFDFIFSLISNSAMANLISRGLTVLSQNIITEIQQKGLQDIVINTMAVIVTLGGIALLGFTLQHVLVEKIMDIINRILEKVPVVNTIYSTVKQLLDMVSGEKAETYKKAVLIEYPRKGSYSVGFLTSESNPIFENMLNEEIMCNIFVPTSPNPTSGIFLSIPKRDVMVLDMKVDDAIKLIISGGAIVPVAPKNKESAEKN